MSKVQVGDKIKLKKEMGPIKTIGSVCTVRLVKDNGDIEFKSPDIPGYGVMSEDELDKYFEIIDPTKPSFDDLENLNDDELNIVTEDLRNRLIKCEELKKQRKLVQLSTLCIGDIFSYNDNEYKIISRLTCNDIFVTLNNNDLRIPYIINSHIFVKKLLDDQK